METPPPPMASYLKRWEEQKQQSRNDRRTQPRWCHGSDVGDELSFISAIERETGEPCDLQTEPLGHPMGDSAYDMFDLPTLDAFPALEVAEETQELQMPTDDEFMDAGALDCDSL